MKFFGCVLRMLGVYFLFFLVRDGSLVFWGILVFFGMVFFRVCWCFMRLFIGMYGGVKCVGSLKIFLRIRGLI